MAKVIFILNQVETIIQSDLEETFRDICTKYLQKVKIKENSVYFLVNGKKNPEKLIKDLIGPINASNNEVKVFVILIDEKNKEEKLIKSKDIICPKCKESCKITMKEGKFKLYECINNHITENIRIKDFLNTQKINMTEIQCLHFN